MRSTNLSNKLLNLVRQARRTTDRLINSKQNLSPRLFALDSDTILAGLRCQERVSSFHPFGEQLYPMPVTSSMEPQRPDLKTKSGSAFTNQPGAGAAGKGSAREAPDHTNINLQQNQLVLNQEFTSLVEQVFHQVTPKSGASAKATVSSVSKEVKHSRQSLSRYSDKKHTSGMAKSRENQGQTGLLSTAESNDSRPGSTQATSTEIHPVFQQLESLVNGFNYDTQSGSPANAKNETSDRETPWDKPQSAKSHLADLTQVLDKRVLDKQTLDKQIVDKRPSQALTSANQRNPAMKTDGKASGTATPLNSVDKGADSRQESQHQSEAVPWKNTGGMQAVMPDIVKRNPNAAIKEQTFNDASVFSAMSPLATQGMADALNDYLQEQAERHGVDLS